MTKMIDQMEKKKYVLVQNCFKPLTDDEIDKLTSLFHEAYYSPGDTIVTEGDQVNSIYLIISGKASVGHTLIQEGKPVFTQVTTLGPNMSIGLNETGFYSISGIRTATVIAQTEMVLLKLIMAEFHGFALTYPHVNEVIRKNAKDFIED